MIAVVDDEPRLADLFTVWLERDYEVRTAYGGSAGLEVIDEDVDAVLVDRLMSDMSGDEVAEVLEECGWDGQLAMVTAVDPDFDIIALGVDEYLVKPVSRDALESTVERLLERASYDDGLRELFALASKRAALESRKAAAELADSEEYRRLDRAIRDLRRRMDETAAGLEDSGFEVALREFE